MSAADWWLATLSRPTAARAAMARRAWPRAGLAFAHSAADRVAYTPCHTRTRAPDRASERNCAFVSPAAYHSATLDTRILRTASGMLPCVTIS